MAPRGIIGLAGVDTSGCADPPDYVATIAKRNADPLDTTHDAVLRAWGTRLCAARIAEVRLTGPAGQHWKTALGF